MLVGFDGYAASPEIKQLIRQWGVGGVVLFARNVDAPEQVADLVRELQEEARRADYDLPLLIGVDQEGGRVARLREPWTKWPTFRELGRTGSAELACGMGRELAGELLACGIGLDFAPVVDVDTNPRNPIINDRSLGTDVGLVGRLAVAFIEGMQNAGVAACAKHFPGHGDTDLDSHLALPVVEVERERLDEVELPPFRGAIDAGVAAVMTAHVVFPCFDEERPASLASVILEDLLRDELGFAGVVVSDDLEMKAISERWDDGETAVEAARAGCDVLAVCKNAEMQIEAVEALIRAAEDGRLRWRENDAALERIRTLKKRFLLPYADPRPEVARASAGTGRARELAEQIALQAARA